MKTSITKKQRKGGFTLIELMVVIAILASLAAIGYGPIIDHMNDGERQKANSNLKSVFTMLQQFKMDNTTFPSDTTADRLEEENPDNNFGELKGNYSNAYFRQLFYKNGVDSEKPFFAKVSVAGLNIAKEGDDKLANGQALRPGENAMSYVMRSGDNLKLPVDKSNVPLAMCSVYPSKTPYTGDKIVFDMSSFRGHVFVLSCDGSVSDREDDIVESEVSDDMGELKKDRQLFPENKRGISTAQRYLILTPETQTP